MVPHDADTEQALLGALLILPEGVYTAVDRLTPADFYVPLHQRVFHGVKSLAEQGKPVDPISVSNETGVPYGDLVGWMTGTAAGSNVEHYVELVRGFASRRRLIAVGHDIVSAAQSRDGDTEIELLTHVTDLLFDASNDKSATAVINDNWDTFLQYLDDIANGVDSGGVRSGYPDLDAHIDRYKPGSVNVLAARPGVGKTSLALNIAANICKAGGTVYFYSLEMNHAELFTKLVGIVAQVRTGDIAKHGSGVGLDHVQATYEALKDRFWSNENTGTTVADLRSDLRRHVARKAGAPDLVIVDYLQLMSSPSGSRSDNRQVEVARMSRDLKVVASQYEVPVLALSQLSRAGQHRTEKRPILSDLRESGAIEQDASTVSFLHRDEDEQDNVIELIVAKNRGGSTGSFQLVWMPETQRFATMARTAGGY